MYKTQFTVKQVEDAPFPIALLREERCSLARPEDVEAVQRSLNGRGKHLEVRLVKLHETRAPGLDDLAWMRGGWRVVPELYVTQPGGVEDTSSITWATTCWAAAAAETLLKEVHAVLGEVAPPGEVLTQARWLAAQCARAPDLIRERDQLRERLAVQLAMADRTPAANEKRPPDKAGAAPAPPAESERDRFEAWWLEAYGARPEGDPECLRAEAADLLRRAARVEVWEAERRAALQAWAERHFRGTRAKAVNGGAS